MAVIEPLVNKRLRRSLANDSADLVYIITDTTNQSVAHNTLDAAAPPIVAGNNGKLLYLEYTETEPDSTAENIFHGFARYSENVKKQMQPTPSTGDSEFSFDVTGQTFRLMNSYGTLRYSAGGLGAADIPDFKGAINVTDTGVEGVDIILPVTKYAETHYLPSAGITNAYVNNLSQVVGKLNQSAFRGLTADRLLLVSVAGARRGAEDWRVSFGWALGSHEQSLTVGGIAVGSKLAHDYLWVLYDVEEDTTAKRLKKTPVGVYVEKVYKSADYSLLGIGT